MRIGIVLSSIGVLPGYERNVSGHVQVPLRTADLLSKAGHEVHLISTKMADADSLPAWLPRDCAVHIITDGRKRGHLSDVVRANKVNGYRPLKLLQQLYEMWQLAKKYDLEIMHFFGFERMIRLAGLFGMFVPRVSTVASVLGRSPARSWTFLYRRVDRILTATVAVQQQWEALGLQVVRAPHGILRNLIDELGSDEINPVRRRVLFWREADLVSGADLCMKAFDQLAPQFPDRIFTFALRRNSTELPGLDELARRHSNLEVYRFPYPPHISLAQLVNESVCVVLPYRDLTIQPQLTVAESLAAGVPVISTQVESISELIQTGRNGLTVPPGNWEALMVAIAELLRDETRTQQMGRNAAADFASNWNWESYSDILEDVYCTLRPNSQQRAISRADSVRELAER